MVHAPGGLWPLQIRFTSQKRVCISSALHRPCASLTYRLYKPVLPRQAQSIEQRLQSGPGGGFVFLSCTPQRFAERSTTHGPWTVSDRQRADNDIALTEYALNHFEWQRTVNRKPVVGRLLIKGFHRLCPALVDGQIYPQMTGIQHGVFDSGIPAQSRV